LTTLSRELAVSFTDTQGGFVSEAGVYRVLKVHDLITSPAFILMKAADRFANLTTAPNQRWQADGVQAGHRRLEELAAAER
jgi:putative transposase